MAPASDQRHAPPVAVGWSPRGDAVRIIDQRRLPGECVERDLRTGQDVCDATVPLAVRGGPAIGVGGARGLAAAMAPQVGLGSGEFASLLAVSARRIRETRPTAVNLAWAIDRLMRATAPCGEDNRAVVDALR